MSGIVVSSKWTIPHGMSQRSDLRYVAP